MPRWELSISSGGRTLWSTGSDRSFGSSRFGDVPTFDVRTMSRAEQAKELAPPPPTPLGTFSSIGIPKAGPKTTSETSSIPPSIPATSGHSMPEPSHTESIDSKIARTRIPCSSERTPAEKAVDKVERLVSQYKARPESHATVENTFGKDKPSLMDPLKLPSVVLRTTTACTIDGVQNIKEDVEDASELLKVPVAVTSATASPVKFIGCLYAEATDALLKVPPIRKAAVKAVEAVDDMLGAGTASKVIQGTQETVEAGQELQRIVGKSKTLKGRTELATEAGQELILDQHQDPHAELHDPSSDTAGHEADLLT